MVEHVTRAEAFASFGAKCRNPRWSWSACSDDEQTVVLTLWEDEFRTENGVEIYKPRSKKRTPNWVNRLGNRERIDNLKKARDNCDGIFRVVYAIAKDTNASPRRIASCYPRPEMRMQLVSLDEGTGVFYAVRLSDDSSFSSQRAKPAGAQEDNKSSKPKLPRSPLDNQTILAIEAASMKAVIAHFQRQGYDVEEVHRDYCGWDLTATKGRETLHLEVKGHRGNEFQFELSPNEYEKMKKMPATYRVCVVRKALESDRVEIFVPERLSSETWILREIGGRPVISLGERIAARAWETRYD
jgi:hypothetical protein